MNLNPLSLYTKSLSPYFHALSHNLGLVKGGCRYSPTCSVYAREAFSSHGLFKGAWLSLLRLLKCNPWSKGGHDPVPPKK